jgi:hypothetical protein
VQAGLTFEKVSLLFLVVFNDVEWLKAQNIIRFVCYLLGKNYNLSIQGGKWLYSFDNIFQTLAKWEPSCVFFSWSSTKTNNLNTYWV